MKTFQAQVRVSKQNSSTSALDESLHRAAAIFALAGLVFILSLFWTKEAKAQEPFHGSVQNELQSFFGDSSVKRFYVDDRLIQYTSKLGQKTQRTMWNAASWKNENTSEFAACQRSYRKIFEDGLMRVNIAFGYSDNFSRTLDAGLYEMAYQAFTSSCYGKKSVCGFRLVGGNSRRAVLEKSLKAPLALGTSSNQLKIRITLTYSAANSRDEDNFSGGKISSSQKSATAAAEQVFFGGIRGLDRNGVKERCDVCVYYGHARDGGGPDFGPVPYEWRDNQGQIDYSQFHSRRTNYRRLLGAISEAQGNPPALVAVLACYSQSHFWKKKACIDRSQPNCKPVSLTDFSSRTGYILTSDYSWFENFERTFGVLMDGVLGLKCASAFKANYGALRSNDKFNEAYGLYGSFLQ